MNADKWIFVVDTEEYSGNFAHKMTAYMVGSVYEQGHGYAEAQVFLEECGEEKEQEFEDLLDVRPLCDDDIPEMTHYGLWPTAEYFNNGLGGCFKDGQEAEAVEHYNDNNLDASKKITIDTLVKYPAYQSFGIFFAAKPSSEVIAFLVERATKYLALPKKNTYDHRPVITGFRLIREEKREIEEWRSKP